VRTLGLYSITLLVANSHYTLNIEPSLWKVDLSLATSIYKLERVSKNTSNRSPGLGIYTYVVEGGIGECDKCKDDEHMRE
jgi:hypothetical protein